MKKLLFLLLIGTVFSSGCKKNNEKEVNSHKQKVEHWANFDDELDVKSEVLVDTALFRQQINSILTPQKIVELFGSGYHNFYLALTISKDSEVHFKLCTDMSYWLSNGIEIKNMIFNNGTDYNTTKKKINLTDKINPKNITNQTIFESAFADTKKIFTAKPGYLNGKTVRSIKLFEINSAIDKNYTITKPWSIREIEISKFRPHLLNPNLNIYYFSTGLPAVSIDGFESIRKAIVYPAEALKNNVAGRVIVQIFADEEGKFAGYQLIKGLGYGCDEEVIDAIKNAKFRGYPTGQRSSIIVPFEFGPPKTSPIDFAVQLFDFNDDPNVYNNIKLGIVNKNILDKNLEKTYFIYVYIDNHLVFQNYCSGISKSATQQIFWFRWKPKKAGNYDYTIYIDPENRLNDSNRENNTVRGTLVVK